MVEAQEQEPLNAVMPVEVTTEARDWSLLFDLPFAVQVCFLPVVDDDADIEPGDRLSAVEEREWRRLLEKALPKRRREWLRGRLAAKEAVRRRIVAEGGVAPSWSEIGIEPDEQGKPHVSLPGMIAPSISLAHTQGGAALAVAGPADRSLGIDLECLGRLRGEREGFERFALTEDERRWLAEDESGGWRDRALLLWIAKEAAAKAIGTGFQGRPARFDVAMTSVEGVAATVRNGAREAWVSLARHDEYVCALAYCP